MTARRASTRHILQAEPEPEPERRARVRGTGGLRLRTAAEILADAAVRASAQRERAVA